MGPLVVLVVVLATELRIAMVLSIEQVYAALAMLTHSNIDEHYSDIGRIPGIVLQSR